MISPNSAGGHRFRRGGGMDEENRTPGNEEKLKVLGDLPASTGTSWDSTFQLQFICFASCRKRTVEPSEMVRNLHHNVGTMQRRLPLRLIDWRGGVRFDGEYRTSSACKMRNNHQRSDAQETGESLMTAGRNLVTERTNGKGSSPFQHCPGSQLVWNRR